MSDLIAIGSSGVRSYARALETVADNVANAANPAYVRRTVTLASAGSPANPGPYDLDRGGGNGVTVASIGRAADALLVDSVRRADADVAGLSAANRWLSGIQTVVTGAASLAGPLNGFFASLSDLASDPASIPVRQAFLSSAGQLTERFHASAAGLDTLAADLAAVTATEMRTLNDLASGLAAVNGQLRRATPGTAAAAIMADDRDRLLAQMAVITTIDVRFNARGEAEVRIPDTAGPLLVSGSESRLAQVNTTGGVLSLRIGSAPGSESAAITGGVLAGLSTGGQLLAETRAGLDQLAQRIASEMNAVQQQGIDLDGQPGEPLFSLDRAAATPAAANGGSARATVDLAPGAAAPRLSLVFDGGSSLWTLTDLDSSTSVSGPSPLALSGATVSISGQPRNGDVFAIERLSAAAAIHVALSAPAGVAAAPAHLVDPAPANSGQAVAELATAPASSPPAAAPFTLTALSSGLVELHDADGLLLASGAVSDWLEGDGFAVRLKGIPAEGDQFRIIPTPPGSAANGNAQALRALADARGPEGTIAEQQDALVGRIATATADVRRRTEIAAHVRDTAAVQLQQASGVDLNQEATEMLRLQQAYQANARIIQTAREIFSAILEAAR